jgi:hypothetical protein
MATACQHGTVIDVFDIALQITVLLIALAGFRML